MCFESEAKPLQSKKLPGTFREGGMPKRFWGTGRGIHLKKMNQFGVVLEEGVLGESQGIILSGMGLRGRCFIDGYSAGC